MSIKSFEVFNAEHGDFVRDLAYDYYGKRLATCSIDGTVKVWDQDTQGRWKASSTVARGHTGSVNRVSWAHPEFGQFLAACSSSRAVTIYEECHDAARGSTNWAKRATLQDSAASVECVSFSPRHLGLRLASASLDGTVRIYTADPAAPSSWSLAESFSSGRANAFALSWNEAPFEPASLAVAADKTARVWELSEAHQRWVCLASLPGHTARVSDIAWAPNPARSYHLIATACEDGAVRVYKLWPRGKPASLLAAVEAAVQALGTAVETEEAAAAVAAASTLGTDDDTAGASVGGASAPAPGAAAGNDGENEGAVVELASVLALGAGQPRRVSWNSLGTVLATSGEEGAVRLWSAGLDGTWKQVLVAAGPQYSGQGI